MSSHWVTRLRLALAAIVVLSSLLALSAWLKNATCGCGSSGLPWETIALVATAVAAASTGAYAGLSMALRRSTPTAD